MKSPVCVENLLSRGDFMNLKHSVKHNNEISSLCGNLLSRGYFMNLKHSVKHNNEISSLCGNLLSKG